ncbi:MAG TPA: T9SS type A sorting domain-containing protein [Cytophagaceae bacterium]|jgi:hypothetical protein
MKKLLLSIAILASMISLESKGQAQDFSSYCSTTAGTTTATQGIIAGQKGMPRAAFTDGQFVATVDTLAGTEAYMSWFVNEFWLGGKPITGTTFTFKVKSSFSGTLVSRTSSGAFSKFYSGPAITLVGGSDFQEYTVTVPEANIDKQKFQEFIFAITPTENVTGGTLTVSEFSYGTQGCGLTSVSDKNDLIVGYSLFPNPSLNNEVNISAKLKAPAPTKVVVKNVAGVEVFSSAEKNTENLSEVINTSDWAKGIYAVSIFTNGVPSTKILVVQ